MRLWEERVAGVVLRTALTRVEDRRGRGCREGGVYGQWSWDG